MHFNFVIRIVAITVAIAIASGPALARKGDSGGASKGDYRSAKSGKYVKKEFAEKHKSTTVREERRKK